MEQKKTLWIIAAVGAFLLVVIGAAVIMYSPSRNSAASIARVAPVKTTQSGWTNQDSNISSPDSLPVPPRTEPMGFDSPAKVNDLYVITDNANVYEVNPSNASSDNNYTSYSNNEASSQGSSTPQNINITVNIPEPKPAPEAPSPAKSTEPSVIKVYEAPSAPAAVSPVEKAPAASVVKKSTAATPAKTTASKTSAAAKTEAPSPAVTKYWVQVAAYSNKKGAEAARSILDSNKIVSDIFTYKDNKDNLFYRVRVGPYMTKSEAEYWKAKISQINDFKKNESYITATTN